MFIVTANSFGTKDFFPYLAITMISFFVILFIISFYCPDLLGSSSNERKDSSKSSTSVFSDGGE